MTRFTPYIPGEPLQAVWTAPTRNDFFRIPRVAEAVKNKRFHRLSLERDGRLTLIAEKDHGADWDVLGYVEGDELDLPTFRFKAVSSV